MNTVRLSLHAVGLISAAVVATAGALAAGEVIKIVTPSSLENAEGSSFATPAAVPRRIQFLFPASEFAGLPESHRRIIAFNFRSDAAQNQPFDWASSDSQIWLSTTDKIPLTLTNKFDDNHGADKTLVHDGAISFPLLATGPPLGPRDLVDGPRLDTPFDYDPSQGNLLLEWIRFDSGNTPRIDAQPSSDPGFRVLLNQTSATAATGSFNNVPAVIQFEYVPEAGDYNLDGAIDAADYVVWRNGLGTNYAQSDYDLWRANFGQTAGSGNALPSAEPLPPVPEPTSIMLSGFAVSALIVVRLRRRAPRSTDSGTVKDGGRVRFDSLSEDSVHTQTPRERRELMKTIRLRWTTDAFVSVAIVAATVTSASGEIIKMVSPSSVRNVESPDFANPAAVPVRIQYLVPASDFAGLPGSHRRIVAWNFRADASQNQPFNWSSTNSRIWLSTTDKTLVHDGAISFPVLATGPAQGPRDVADGPRLQTPFTYDPSKGNLLIEWMRFDGPISPRIDVLASNAPGATVLLNQTSPSATTGNLLNLPPVIQFEFDAIPEPSTVALAGLVFVSLLARRRRRRGFPGL